MYKVYCDDFEREVVSIKEKMNQDKWMSYFSNQIGDFRIQAAKVMLSKITNEEIEDLYYANIFWSFFKKLAWLTMKEEKRVIDVLMTHELKLAIELYSLSNTRVQNEAKYLEQIEIYNNNFELITQNVATIPEKFKNQDLEMQNMEIGKLVKEYSNFSDFYKFINYVQHNAIAQSAVVNYNQYYVIEEAKKLILKMISNFLDSISETSHNKVFTYFCELYVNLFSEREMNKFAEEYVMNRFDECK